MGNQTAARIVMSWNSITIAMFSAAIVYVNLLVVKTFTKVPETLPCLQTNCENFEAASLQFKCTNYSAKITS